MKKIISLLLCLLLFVSLLPVAFADAGVLTPITSDSCTVTVPDSWAACYWWVGLDGEAHSVTPIDGLITVPLAGIISSNEQYLYVSENTSINYSFVFGSPNAAALDSLSDDYTIASGDTTVEITGADATMEYRDTSITGSAFIPVSLPLLLPEGTYSFRIKASVVSGPGKDKYYFPSEREAEVTVSPASPVAGEFRFTGPAKCEVKVPTDWENYYYWIDNGTASKGNPTGGILTLDNLPVEDTVHTLNVSDTTSLKAGYSFKFKAPNRAPLDKLSASYPLGKDAAKARITNATSAMEYRLSDGRDFSVASSSLELPLGDYQFRIKATMADDVYVAPSTVRNVSVTPYVPPTPPTELVITDPASSCTFTAAGAEYWFTAELLPESSDKSGYSIIWVSSNPNVAKVADVKENGTKARIVSVAAGTCTITAKCEALGLSSIRSVSVLTDFRFTSKNKLVFYYDNRSKSDCNFATTIPAELVSKVTVNGISMPFYKDSKGNISITYSSMLNTFGSKSAKMPLRVYYGSGNNQYIEKTLYYWSIYDAPLTGDRNMGWAYAVLFASGVGAGLLVPILFKKSKRNSNQS